MRTGWPYTALRATLPPGTYGPATDSRGVSTIPGREINFGELIKPSYVRPNNFGPAVGWGNTLEGAPLRNGVALAWNGDIVALYPHAGNTVGGTPMTRYTPMPKNSPGGDT